MVEVSSGWVSVVSERVSEQVVPRSCTPMPDSFPRAGLGSLTTFGVFLRGNVTNGSRRCQRGQAPI